MRLPHRTVQTPVFMPVGTLGTVKAVPQDVLETLGAEIILGNTYHLYLRPGHEAVRRMGGLHKFISWPRAMLTDSGGFQVFSLSQLRKVSDEGVRFRSHLDGSSHFFTPEHSMDVQIALGADIAMAFDECTEYPADRNRAEESLRLTMAWARRSLDHFRAHRDEVVWRDNLGVPQVPGTWGPGNESPTQSLFGIVQGGTYRDLRRESAERLVEMDFDGYAIGGLAVGEGQAAMFAVLDYTAPALPAGRPRYLMGVGTPDDLLGAVARGVDMFDCVMPTRAGRTARAYTSRGVFNIRNARFAADPRPLDPGCACPLCTRHARAYLHHLFRCEEMLGPMLLTWHNIQYYQDFMRGLRDAILQGRLAAHGAAVRARWAEGDDPP